MIRYLALITFTQQGMANVAESIERASQFQARVTDAGGKVLHQYWAMGEIDGCLVFEVPDAATGAAVLLQLAREDNVRTRTSQIFNAVEFDEILRKACQ